jgi:hypothetical protein
MEPKPPWRPTGRSNILLLLLLLIVLGIAFIWGWEKNPPGTAQPSATANPEVAPQDALPSK